MPPVRVADAELEDPEPDAPMAALSPRPGLDTSRSGVSIVGCTEPVRVVRERYPIKAEQAAQNARIFDVLEAPRGARLIFMSNKNALGGPSVVLGLEKVDHGESGQ